MRRFLAVLLLLCATVPAAAQTPRAPDVLPHGPLPARVWVCFVPAQQCDTPIVAAIRNARHTVRVQAYGFTAPMILGALGEARERGVDVRAILDKSNDPATRRDGGRDGAKLVGAQFTAAMGIPTWIDHSVAIAHNKLIIIDGKVVIGGSYNFTVSAEDRNAENVTFIESPVIAELYGRNWEGRRAVSREYRPPQAFDTDRMGSLARR